LCNKLASMNPSALIGLFDKILCI